MKVIQENTFQIIQKTVDGLVNMVRSTYGPTGKKVIIHKNYNTAVLDDGVSIADAYESESDVENAILSVIKEVSRRTNDRVGDGTTSSLILLQGIIHEINRKGDVNGKEVAKSLKKGFEEAKAILTKQSKKINTKEDLKSVAFISFRDEKIASLIAEVIHKIGTEGVISVQETVSRETTFESEDGIELPSGWLSPYFINQPERMEVVIENPYILLTDYRLVNGGDITSLLNKISTTGIRNIVIVADNVEGDALASCVVNNSTFANNGKRGGFNILAVACPQGDKKKEFLEDLAILTGGEMLTNDKAVDWQSIDLSLLGKAEKVIAKKDKTVILGAKGRKKEVQKAIAQLRELIKSSKTDYEREGYETRLARFLNGIAVVKVGAVTENERRALKFKIEDAVNAVKVAYRGGVVSGAGVALANIKTSSPVLNAALQYPFKQLKENTGFTDIILKENEAFNGITGEIGNYLKLGIIDPVEVLIAGIESAVSIASLLCDVSGILYEEKPKET